MGYALRAIVWPANHGDDPQTNQQIDEATLVPAGYLAKVMQSLARVGLVATQRGKHGGFVLARPAEEVSSADPGLSFGDCRIAAVRLPLEAIPSNELQSAIEQVLGRRKNNREN